jgi:hypothetical protein
MSGVDHAGTAGDGRQRSKRTGYLTRVTSQLKTGKNFGEAAAARCYTRAAVGTYPVPLATVANVGARHTQIRSDLYVSCKHDLIDQARRADHNLNQIRSIKLVVSIRKDGQPRKGATGKTMIMQNGMGESRLL